MMRQQKCDAGGGAETNFQQTVALVVEQQYFKITKNLKTSGKVKNSLIANFHRLKWLKFSMDQPGYNLIQY